LQKEMTEDQADMGSSLEAKSEWEFSFLEKSLFNTPVPLRERWGMHGIRAANDAGTKSAEGVSSSSTAL
jgi:hypothetical protein